MTPLRRFASSPQGGTHPGPGKAGAVGALVGASSVVSSFNLQDN